MRVLNIILFMVSIWYMGCGGAQPVAPVSANGQPIRIAFFLDAGFEQIDANNPNHVTQRTALADYVKKDMVNRLVNAGYEVRVLEDPAQYGPDTDEYLLSLKVEEYNAGSKAARVLVGFGAGSASMDSVARLFKGNQPLMEKPQHITTSRSSWEKIVNKTNQLIVQEVVGHTV